MKRLACRPTAQTDGQKILTVQAENDAFYHRVTENAGQTRIQQDQQGSQDLEMVILVNPVHPVNPVKAFLCAPRPW
jgi:hypothetical protein